MPAGESKTCTKCGEAKPLDAYYFREGKPIAACKDCTKASNRAHREANLEKARRVRREWYAKNRAANLAYQAEWREKNREQKRAYDAEWRAANLDRKLATDAAYREANKAQRAEYFREYNQNNKAKKQDWRRNRRARKAGGFVSRVYFQTILKRDLGVCGICSEQIMEDTIELDHIIPLAAGGTHEPNNVQLAHRSCNRRKATKVA